MTEAFDELEKYIFQTDAAGAKEAPTSEVGEGGEGVAEAMIAVAEGDDTTMAEGDAGAAEKE